MKITEKELQEAKESHEEFLDISNNNYYSECVSFEELFTSHKRS